MKIAVVGAPGVGKYLFASSLVRKLGWDEDNVIVGYVQSMREITGQEYGEFGNHIDDFQITFKRREWEQVWRGRDTITCGTVLDSAAHWMARSEYAAQTRGEVALMTEKLRTVAGTFGLLYTDTWEYDYAFYLKYTGENHYSRLIDRTLAELITRYRAPVLSFTPEVPDDEKAKTAAEAIAAFEADEAPSPDERGVRPGGESGSENRDSSESVPDVPEQGRAPDDA